MEVLAEYRVGLAGVRIVESGGECRYIVEEPPLPAEAVNAYTGLLEWFRVHGGDPGDPGTLWLAAESLGVTEIVDSYEASILYFLERELRGYGKLQPFIEDPGLEEIGVGPGPGPVRVVHRFYCEGWMESNVMVESEGEARSLALRLARAAGTTVSAAFPLREFSLAGHRVTIVLGGEVSFGTSITIRLFPDKPMTLEDLVSRGTLPAEAAAFLEAALRDRRMILFTGGQSTGKTTLLNALLLRVPSRYRIVTVEETPELRLEGRNWIPLYTREPLLLSPEAERSRISIEDLVRIALRLRADYVVVTEARGREVHFLFEAAALGSGSMATFHSGSLRELLARLSLLGVSQEYIPLLEVVVFMGREGPRRFLDELYVNGGDGYVRVYSRRDGWLVPGLLEGLEERVQYFRRLESPGRSLFPGAIG